MDSSRRETVILNPDPLVPIHSLSFQPMFLLEGVKIARAVGAALIDMEKIQIHPTGFVDPAHPSANPKILAPEALRGLGKPCHLLSRVTSPPSLVETTVVCHLLHA